MEADCAENLPVSSPASHLDLNPMKLALEFCPFELYDKKYVFFEATKLWGNCNGSHQECVNTVPFFLLGTVHE